jgi:4-amino-4-deoxy-L-arabinose transferase-like glycosyltransferase
VALYHLSAKVFSRGTALLAALLAALAPLLVWYSQELRMFQPATTWLVLATYCLISAWPARGPAHALFWWSGMIVAMVAALYSYLFSAIFMPALGLSLLILLWHTRRWRPFLAGVIALAITTLIFLPLALNAWGVNAAEADTGVPFQGAWATSWNLLQLFSVWRVPWPPLAISAVVTIFAAAFILGFTLPNRPASTPFPQRLLLLNWVMVPFLVANLLLASSASIFAEDRYHLYLAPFVLLAMARGSMQLTGRYPWYGRGLASALALALLLSVSQLWSPLQARENWRAAASYILHYQAASPELPAAVVTHVDYTHQALEWYLRQHVSFDDLPLFFPFGGPLNAEDVETVIAPPLRGLVNFGSQTLWLTQSHLEGIDDGRLVESWLLANFPLITEQYPAGIKLSGYALQYRFTHLPAPLLTPLPQSQQVTPELALAACEIVNPVLPATENFLHPPSGWVHIRSWWHATIPIAGDYTITAHLMNETGVWGEMLPNPHSTVHHWPTSRWATDEFVRVELDVNLNPLTPPAPYQLILEVVGADGMIAGKGLCGEVVIVR